MVCLVTLHSAVIAGRVLLTDVECLHHHETCSLRRKVRFMLEEGIYSRVNKRRGLVLLYPAHCLFSYKGVGKRFFFCTCCLLLRAAFWLWVVYCMYLRNVDVFLLLCTFVRCEMTVYWCSSDGM